MSLDQVKEIIISNQKVINELTRTRPENYIFDFLKECISLMEEEDPSKIDKSFLKEYRFTILNFIDVLIKTKTSQPEKIIVKAIADLLYNISVNYSISKNSTELNALIILSDASKSLEDILYVLMFMFSKLSNQLYEEPSSSFLSRKYYTELSDFLENRKSHDEKYNI